MAYMVRYSVTKQIQAPIEKVFDWCTDYCEDDPKLTGSPGRYINIRKSQDSVTFDWERPFEGRTLTTHHMVKLGRPYRWIVQLHDDLRDIQGEYRLEAVNKGCKLTMNFNVTLNNKPSISMDEYTQQRQSHADKLWDDFIIHLEHDVGQ